MHIMHQIADPKANSVNGQGQLQLQVRDLQEPAGLVVDSQASTVKGI